MAKNPITASERRGIIAVAALALLITGAGLWLARCGRPETTVTPEEVEVLLDGTSPSREVGDSSRTDVLSGNSDRGSKKNKHDKGRKKEKGKQSKSYRKRSLLDEPVSPD